MLKKNCDFCNEFSLDNKLNTFEKLTEKSPFSRIVLETSYFVVVPTLGELESGHLLIIPKRHITALIYLSRNEKKQIGKIVNLINTVYKKENGVFPTYFEHGTPNIIVKEDGGQCIDHAHLHILPQNINLLKIISSSLNLVTEREGVNFDANIKQNYICYIPNKQGTFFFSGLKIESQLVRKLYSSAISKPEKWNWGENINIEETKISAIKYKQLFEKA